MSHSGTDASVVVMGSTDQSPLLPFQRNVLSFNVILFEVCLQSVTTPPQHHGKPTVYFLNVLIVKVSPILVWVTPMILGCILKDARQTFCFFPFLF